MGFTGAMVTLPFGADTTVFYPREDEAEDATGPRLIVSTRNFEPIYNVHLLIEALPKILAGAPSAKVIVIGSGSLREQLERRTRELGVEDHVEFTGKLAATEIAQYLSRAAIFVTTSLSDGNNISLNEAMACGAFPVVTDIPANREWIENGRNGFLVSTHDSDELAEQILAGLDAPNLRRAAADLNWKLIQQRGSWKTAMARMENEYFSIMNRVCTHDAFPGV
jgi:glycosyltransferase involved in cell wall biosynthesis